MKKITLSIMIMVVMMALPAVAKANSAINFTAKDIAGNTVELYGYKDKVVVLDFWATWCPPCRKEIPNLIDIKNTFKNKPFEIVSVALERGSDEKAVQFVKEHKMDWVHIINKEVGRKLAQDYKIMYIPTMYIIKNGKIVATGLRGHDLKNKIKELLN